MSAWDQVNAFLNAHSQALAMLAIYLHVLASVRPIVVKFLGGVEAVCRAVARSFPQLVPTPEDTAAGIAAAEAQVPRVPSLAALAGLLGGAASVAASSAIPPAPPDPPR